MNREQHILLLKKSLSERLGECCFYSEHNIEYIDDTGAVQWLRVDLYEENNNLIIFANQQLNEDVKSQLRKSGYTLLEYENGEHIALSRTAEVLIQQSNSSAEKITGGFNAVDSETEVQQELKESIIIQSTTNREELNDLIGKSPGWLLRSGITILFFVVFVIIAFTAIIKYPDKIVSTGILTSDSPPIGLMSLNHARVEKIIAPTGTIVEEGDPIIYLKNTTDLGDLDRIKKYIEEVDFNKPTKVVRTVVPEVLSLGSMQQVYGQLYLTVREYQQIIGSRGTINQVNNINEEIENIGLLNHSLLKEKDLYGKEKALLIRDLKRQTQLFEEGVISELDFEQKKSSVSQFERQYESLEKTSVQSNIRLEALETEIVKLEEDRAKQLQQYQFKIAAIIEDLRMSMYDWEEMQYIKAEVSGVIELSDDIVEKSSLDAQTTFGYVIPDQADRKYAKVLITPQRRGEINIGNKCLLKLDAYPYKEYGLIVSEVGSLSRLSTKQTKELANLYEVIIPIEGEMITEYKDTIDYSPNMSLVAEIITEEKTLLFRIMSRFTDLLKNN